MKTGEEYHVGQTPGERRLDKKRRVLQDIVNAQKNMKYLWAKTMTSLEGSLQYELGRLHAAIESREKGQNGMNKEEQETPL